MQTLITHENFRLAFQALFDRSIFYWVTNRNNKNNSEKRIEEKQMPSDNDEETGFSSIVNRWIEVNIVENMLEFVLFSSFSFNNSRLVFNLKQKTISKLHWPPRESINSIEFRWIDERMVEQKKKHRKWKYFLTMKIGEKYKNRFSFIVRVRLFFPHFFFFVSFCLTFSFFR